MSAYFLAQTFYHKFHNNVEYEAVLNTTQFTPKTFELILLSKR